MNHTDQSNTTPVANAPSTCVHCNAWVYPLPRSRASCARESQDADAAGRIVLTGGRERVEFLQQLLDKTNKDAKGVPLKWTERLTYKKIMARTGVNYSTLQNYFSVSKDRRVQIEPFNRVLALFGLRATVGLVIERLAEVPHEAAHSPKGQAGAGAGTKMGDELG